VCWEHGRTKLRARERERERERKSNCTKSNFSLNKVEN
jgi:hypothetical protein